MYVLDYIDLVLKRVTICKERALHQQISVRMSAKVDCQLKVQNQERLVFDGADLLERVTKTYIYELSFEIQRKEATESNAIEHV